MAEIFYLEVDDFLRKEERYKLLEKAENVYNVDWSEIAPDKNHIWLTEGMEDDWDSLIPLGTKEAKQLSVVGSQLPVMFKLFSLGISTNRDAWVYNCNRRELEKNMLLTIDFFNQHIFKFERINPKPVIDSFVQNENIKISWSRDLKLKLKRGLYKEFDKDNIRISMYRPFYKNFVYYDKIWVDITSQFSKIFPTPDSEKENRVICLSGVGSSKPFQSLIVNFIPCLDILEKTQCFPFYTYSEDGTGRKENISDWALKEFKTNFKDESISKWDIFYYIYGILHKPEYREKYAANLRCSLPRIPLYEEFWKYSNAGMKLADLHVNYETQPEYPLTKIEAPGKALDWRVEKMKYVKTDADTLAIKYNDFLTLAGIPYEVKEYKLGNRSALDWLIDQYQIKTDKRSGITNDPNREDEPDYIVKLIGKIVYVSLETMKIVKDL